jgi:hypothetical protein
MARKLFGQEKVVRIGGPHDIKKQRSFLAEED